MGSSNTRGLQIPDDVVGDAKFSNGPNCGRAHLLIHSLGLANVSHLLLRQVRVCGMIHLATYGWPPGRYAQAQGYYSTNGQADLERHVLGTNMASGANSVLTGGVLRNDAAQ